MEHIAIFDTTLRDGEQAPGFSMNTGEKLRMARALDRLGVDILEAGFPIASDGDFDAVRRIAGEIRGPRIAALARANRKDIEQCARALQPALRSRIHVVLATSDIHLKYKLAKSRSEALDMAAEAVRIARNLCDDVQFSAEDAGRSDVDYLCQVFDTVIEAGATVINIPDTVGYCMPDEYGWLIRTIHSRIQRTEGVTLSVHCHNDLGLAVANSLSGVHNGARQVECTVNGIGERAGNAALEEVVMAIQVRRRLLNVSTGICTREIYPASRLLSDITRSTVQKNKAIVGENAFAHESGIHQDGVLKESSTYEIIVPESVGIPASRLVLGKHSGRHALRQKLHDLGFDLSAVELEGIYTAFTALADRVKTVNDRELVLLVDEQRNCTHP